MGKHVKKKSNKLPKILLLIIFVILSIISIIKIIEWYSNSKENNEINKQILETVTIDETQDEKDKYNVNFEKLKEQNLDTIAWLKVNGTNVEYTVVKTNNNDYYLNHNFEKKYNEAGWIFADYQNKFDGTDKNIVIYGHNRVDNSMFGSLKNILNAEWYNNKENLKINLITENEKCIYEVFSVYQIKNEDYYIQTNFKNDTEYDKFLQTIKGRSVNDFYIELTSEDSVLTLSTCANNYRDRIVLHAKKINE